MIPAEYAEGRISGRTAWPVEPWATISNAAYLGAAWDVWHRGGFAGSAMALAFVALALGSAACHAWRTPLAIDLDRAAMHVTLVALAVHGIAPGTVLGAVLMIPLGCAAAFAFVWIGYVNLSACVAVYLVAAILGALVHGDLGLTLLALGVLAIGFGSWVLDHWPTPPLGRFGHAVWHLASAAGLALLYRAQG